MEAEGKEAYRKEFTDHLPNVTVNETGLWKNPKYPQLPAAQMG